MDPKQVRLLNLILHEHQKRNLPIKYQIYLIRQCPIKTHDHLRKQHIKQDHRNLVDTLAHETYLHAPFVRLQVFILHSCVG